MKLLLTIFFGALAFPRGMAQNSTTPAASGAASTSLSPEYTITALPAVKSGPSCLFNCLIPIGLADPSGCDDVTNDCACLSAPANVLDFLTDCIQTVCPTSTSALGASATSLYESYCNSIYGTAVFTSAFEAEASAAAASSVSAEASTTSSSSSTKTSSSSSPSSTAKSSAAVAPSLDPFWLMTGLAIFGGLIFVGLL